MTEPAEEINQFFAEMHAACQPILAELANKIRWFKFCAYGIIFIWSVVAVVLFGLKNWSGLAVAFVLLVIVTCVNTFTHLSKVTKLEVESKLVAAHIMIKYNNNSFVARGLRWGMPPQFPMFVVLQKEYLGGANTCVYSTKYASRRSY